MSTVTWWAPPPAPLDVWAAVRAQAPDTDDHAARHQRGVVRLPWDLGPDQLAGALVAAWVCCDPACGGVELGEYVLEINHGCCSPWSPRRHTVGYGHRWFTGFHHGPYTPYWQPEAATRG